MANLCKQRGKNPAARRIADTDALRHGAKGLDQAGRLRRGVAKSRKHALAIDSKHLPAAAAEPNTPQVEVMCHPRL